MSVEEIETMSESEFADALSGVIQAAAEFGDEIPEADRFADVDVRTFVEAGLLTNNRGLVIELQDGSSYQVTIVRDR